MATFGLAGWGLVRSNALPAIKGNSQLNYIINRENTLPFIHELGQESLEHIKSQIDLTNQQSHPLNAKVTNALRKCIKVGHSIKKGRESEPTKCDLNQGTLTIEEVKDKIRKEGGNLKSLSLNEVDDELLVLISANCSQLQILEIRQRADRYYEKLTNKGLIEIAKLKKLTAFTFEVSNPSIEDDKGLAFVIKSLPLLTELNLETWFISDLSIASINTLSSLTSLSLSTYMLPDTSLVKLKVPTLTKLALTQMTGANTNLLTDAVLLQFSGIFKKLTSLTIAGQQTVTNEGATALINSNPHLTQLAWSGFGFSDTVTQAIPSTVTYLAIDASSVTNTGWGILLQRLTSLQSLRVEKGGGFASGLPSPEYNDNIQQLPKTLRHLYVDSDQLYSLEGMPPLESLALENMRLVDPSVYRAIMNLPLTTFRAINCPVNDQILGILIEGQMVATVQNLEFCNCPIGDRSVKFVEKFSNLRVLMIAECNSITQEGLEQLLKSPTLRRIIEKLYLYNFPIKLEEYTEWLNQWPKLDDFFGGNLLGQSLNQALKIRRLEQRNLVNKYWMGAPLPYETFVHAL